MAICGNCFNGRIENQACETCGYENSENLRSHPTALRVGAVLNGRFVVGRVLGQGGFGVTYLAQELQTRKRIAVKEYFPTEYVMRVPGTTEIQFHTDQRLNEFETGKQQFLAEARTLAQFLGDEHIVQVYRYFEENNTAYFAMEFVNGEPLNSYLQKRGSLLAVEEANGLLLPLMGSLAKVHEKGVVHRDISPDNIIITPQGTAKLIDFGAARYSTGEMSKSLDVILKHGFAPKEQYIRRSRQGPFTDVYAFAATWYYAITGKVPPDALERMDEDPLIPPSELGVKISRETETVLLKALSFDYKDRYQNMAEFRDALIQAASVSAQAPAETPKKEQKTVPVQQKTEKDVQPPQKETQNPSHKNGFPSWLKVAVPVLVAVIILAVVISTRKPDGKTQSSAESDASVQVAAAVEQTVETVAEEVPATARVLKGSASGLFSTIEVEVIADESTIYSITIIGHGDTPEIGGVAMEKISSEIVEQQSLQIDAVAGATESSHGVMEAVENALLSGGIDSSVFKSKSGQADRSSDIRTVGSIVTLGSYEQDNDRKNGPEPIEWIVLDVQDGKSLLISRYLLDRVQYDTTYSVITWEDSTLRGWLNDTFLNAAFSEEERACIMTVTVPADKNPDYDISAGNPTQDQIFILSMPEAERYFTSDEARAAQTTAYATAQEGISRWWLRSPGFEADCAAEVSSAGNINSSGNRVYYGLNTIRPAMWINTDKVP